MMMTRRRWSFLLLCLCGCHASSGPRELLPATVGPWQRTSLHDVPVAEAPGLVSRTGLKRIQAAVYEGPGGIDVRVYELTSSALGLDLSQRWRPEADTVFFYQDSYFVVVKWRQADRKALQEFVRAIERQLR